MKHLIEEGVQEQYCYECEKKRNCDPCEEIIKNVVLARAYVPIQKICQLYSCEEALKQGTAFPELASPYHKP